MDEWAWLLTVPQTHYVGAEDEITGWKAVAGYVERFPAASRPSIRVLRDFTHGRCWAEELARLSQELAQP